MEPQVVDYYNEMPAGVNVIDKMNEELAEIQDKYNELKRRYEPEYELEHYIKRAEDSHYDMAKLVYRLYRDNFRCTSIKKNEWYFFDDEEKKWKLSDGAIELRLKLSNEVFKMFEYRAFREIPEGSVIEGFYKTGYHKTYINLKNSTYKNIIIKECKDLFYDRNFLTNFIMV